MSINPLAISLGIPIAAGAIGSGLKLAQQSFHRILSGEVATQPTVDGFQSAEQSHSSTTEQLENLAQGVRNWLDQHGVRLPYTVSITDQAAEQPNIEIEGVEKAKIAELLDSIPGVLEQLRDLVRSESRMTPFGLQGKMAVVTESSSYLT